MILPLAATTFNHQQLGISWNQACICVVIFISSPWMDIFFNFFFFNPVIFLIFNSILKFQKWCLETDANCTQKHCNTPKIMTRISLDLQSLTFLLLWSTVGWLAKSHSYWASLRIGWDGYYCQTLFWAFILQHHPSGALSATARDWTTTSRSNFREQEREWMLWMDASALIWRSTCLLKRFLFN